MILIADSGSTKTDWLVLKNGHRKTKFQSPGLNPFYLNMDEIYKDLEEFVRVNIPVTGIQQIFFYGAGCGILQKKTTIQDALQLQFPHARVEIKSDMLGAARAVFQNDKGLTVILGTGANSCFYDGKEIIQTIPPLGYVLGDEGSGAALGRRWMSKLLCHNLPGELEGAFKEKYMPDVEEIKTAVYSGKRPNLYLAAFTPFLSEHINHPYVYKFLTDAFIDMFHYQVFQFKNWQDTEVRMVGSVAFYFGDILREISAKLNIHLTSILQSPIDELIKFHR